MKIKKRLFIFSLFVFAIMANANTNKYRLTLRDNPATSIVVGWNQVSGNDAVVYYGTTDFGTNWSSYPNSKTVDRAVSYKGMNNRFARLTGLQPNTNYYFVLRDNEGTSARFWFRTGSNNPSDRISFIAGGDSRNNRTPRINANRLVAKLKPDAVLFGGDMTDDDTNSEWSTWFDDWQNTIASDGRMFPIIATRGNHEDSNNSVYNLFDVPSPNVYYAITFGGSLIRAYTLNSEISISGSQTTWLTSDLQSANTTWKMAQYHKPMRPHVSSKSEGNSIYNSWAQPFHDNGVNLVVECDSHTVKSTWPVRPSTGSGSDEGFIRDDNNGTVYVGEGCWGAPLRSNNDSKNWTRNSGSFNQFKWIFVDQAKIEVRTVKVDNASQVGEVSNTNRFTIPSNLDLWNPSNGSVVTITGNLSAPTCNITSPSNGQYYSSPQNITISANASDSDGTVSEVEFFVNGNSIGTDTSSPYSRNYTIPADGIYSLTAVARDNDGLTTTSSTATITVGVVSQTIEKRIASGSDDVEQNGNDGSMYTDSSDIEMVNDGSQGNQVVGLRFTGMNIPQGATISNAYIQFTTDETSSGTTNLTIKGEDINDAASFTTATNNVSDRTTTAASVNWNPSAWNSVGASGSAQRTPDMKSIIQEIVNRSGWDPGNDMVMIITGTGERTAEAYEGSASSAALLHVEYTTGGGSSNVSPACTITNPSNGQSYSSPQTISISANASDSDGSVTQVEFFVNGNSIGTDTTSPYSRSYALPSSGSYTLTAVATDNDNATTTSSAVSITVSGSTSQTFSKRIAGGSDDVEENGNDGSVYTNSSDIEMVNDDGQAQGNQVVGLRFTGITVPQGASISNAYIQFTTDETSSGSTSLTIRGQDVNDAPAFTTATNNVSNRTTTSASVNWNPSAWNSVGASGSAQRTPDMKSIIQEIVNRSGWNSGNDMVMIITGTGERTAEAYEGSASSAALLYLEYTTGGGSTNIPPTCTLTSPSNGTSYSSLQQIAISVDAADSDGSVSQVEFFVNGNSIGTDTTSPYSVNWTIPAFGSYDLSAVATDNDAATTTSSIININATDPGSGGCTTTQIDFNDFEGGYGIWNDGGSDCSRISSTTYANSGSISLRLRDDSSSSFTNTDNIDLSDFEEVTVDFSYICNSMDNSNEDFWLQISTNGGSSYTTVEEWNRGDEFENNIRYNETVTLQGPFTSNTRFRFVCDASSNGDQVYLDDINISGCSNSTSRQSSIQNKSVSISKSESPEQTLEDLVVHPNPFDTNFTIKRGKLEGAGKVEIYDLRGKLVYRNSFNKSDHTISVQTKGLSSGVFYLKIYIGEKTILKKLLKN